MKLSTMSEDSASSKRISKVDTELSLWSDHFQSCFVTKQHKTHNAEAGLALCCTDAHPRAHLGLACTALAAAMQKSPRAHDDSLLRACHAMTAYSSPCCLPCVSLRSQRWLRVTAGNLTVLA